MGRNLVIKDELMIHEEHGVDRLSMQGGFLVLKRIGKGRHWENITDPEDKSNQIH